MAPPYSRRFDWLVACVSYVLIGGCLIDAWSHYHETIETFFTPSHAVIYGSFVLLLGIFAWEMVTNRRKGYAWNNAVPSAYRWSVAGLGLFFAGGFGDLIWHTFMGVEAGIDVLLSPTHLTIGLALLMIFSGPVRSLMERRSEAASLTDQLPALIALAAILSAFHFGTQFAMQPGADAANAPLRVHGFSPDLLTLLAIGFYKQGYGILIVMFQSVLIAAIVLFAVRTFSLRPGALTTLLLLGNLQAAAMLTNGPAFFVTVAVMSLAAGIAGDWLVARMRPSEGRVAALRVFGFCVPAVYFGAYMLICAMMLHGVWWDWNVVLGAILYAGAIGFGLSFLIAPSSLNA